MLSAFGLCGPTSHRSCSCTHEKDQRLTSSHSEVKDGVLSEFPLELSGSVAVDSLQFLLGFCSLAGQEMRLESDFETYLDKCMSSSVFGNERILPSVQARSTNPAEFTAHWSAVLVVIPASVFMSIMLLLEGNMVLFEMGGFVFLTGGSVQLFCCSCVGFKRLPFTPVLWCNSSAGLAFL